MFVHVQPCSALKAALLNQVFLYLITDNKYAFALYSGFFPPGQVTSLFDAVPAIIHETGNIFFWLFFPIFMVIDDLWFYAYHRLVHAVPFLYKNVSNFLRNRSCPLSTYFDLETVSTLHWFSITHPDCTHLQNLNLSTHLSDSHGAPWVLDSVCHHFALYTPHRNCTSKCWRGRCHN